MERGKLSYISAASVSCPTQTRMCAEDALTVNIWRGKDSDKKD
ncbi:hypothetical protein MmTuc01_0975 [Methanosarcina mazei Tuc01]|uniref:Uncharacterized protein n=1 Tax=Methanosarcina mazei Tuc01 TaxID=1236903 RepID=M1QHD5_METMZ|nr:hypothetical protein MmTuc01_0975 [Methanosarcina mazei Tuc01]